MRRIIPSWQQTKAALKQHYSAPLSDTFQHFRLGAACFFCGSVIIWIALQSLPSSALQEAVLLLGLLVAGGGFLVAMLAQMRHIISRFVRFWWGD